MKFWNKIKNFVKRGGREIDMALNGKILANITDHPKITIEADEYQRINENIRYYSNIYKPVEFINSKTKKRTRPFYPLNITKTAARRLASIIFNEKCKISIAALEEEAEESFIEEANELLEEIFQSDNFYNLFESNLEKGIALGGFAMRPYVNDEGKIKIAWIRADQFYPLKSNTNEVTECAIATRTIRVENDQTIYYTLLEFHEWIDGTYVITNELYRSENQNVVGTQIPLERIYPNLAETVTMYNLSRPLFVYFKTPGANNKCLESPLGVGIVDNAKEILDQINITHDQFYREIKLGKRRVLIPEQYIRINENDPERQPYFDDDEDTFIGLRGDSNENKSITDLTVQIRTVQYKDALQHLIREFEVQIGLSTGAMTYANDGVKTATEIVSNNSMTYQTRSSYLTMVEKAINELVHSIFELASYKEFFSNRKELFNIESNSYCVDVFFDDGVFVDKDKQLEDDLKVAVAGIMPKKEFLKRNYGLSDTEADEWISQLISEMPGNDNNTENAFFDEGD
ncbi:phage portal protein [Enterococcus faecium]|nr:phage portal protein [Enterococcus faecium]EME7158858.1 phage portal protein [Enterococcus faecium]